MAEAAPLLGVVVVSYGDPGLLERHVLQHDLSALPAVVVVVDNLSTARARRDAEELCRRRGLEFVPLPSNEGFGAGANAGAARALELGCSVLLFLNPDAALDAATAAALRDDVLAHPRRMVSPQVVHPDGRRWFSGAELSLRNGWTRRTGVLAGPELHPWLTGACLAVHRDLWRELGGFDGSYFLYWEDVDLSVRCVRLGGELAVRQDLTVVHAVGGTQDGGGKSPLYGRYNCRNRLLFARKNLSRRRRLRWLLVAPAYAGEVALRGGLRRLLGRRRVVAAVLSGTLAGALVVLDPRNPGDRGWSTTARAR
ncbi:glycosyltransferase family 2 protein [Kineococcus glutinatus]|uniref:glycosyltransferase family 2 protein n=1 Tax=Kineococcus glutinatus TaxID=1070872 RepID=UPI0031EDD4A4